MNTKKILQVLTLMLFVFGLVSFALPSSAKAAEPCTCVTYMKWKYGLPGGVGSAANYGPKLLATGYKLQSKPIAGSVIVFSKGAWGADKANGHVGYVVSASYSTITKKWTIVVEHAKWSVGTIINGISACNSKGDVRRTIFVRSDISGVAFYKK